MILKGGGSKPLSKDEVQKLAKLLSRLTWPLPHAVFHQLVTIMPTNPIELAVFDQEGRILLIPRPPEDKEFQGHHMPGTVRRFGEEIPTALNRLLQSEAKAAVSTPVNLGWWHCNADDESPRDAIALLYACRLQGTYTGRGQFFDPENPPQNTLKHHKIMIPIILERARSAAFL